MRCVLYGLSVYDTPPCCWQHELVWCWTWIVWYCVIVSCVAVSRCCWWFLCLVCLIVCWNVEDTHVGTLRPGWFIFNRVRRDIIVWKYILYEWMLSDELKYYIRINYFKREIRWTILKCEPWIISFN